MNEEVFLSKKTKKTEILMVDDSIPIDGSKTVSKTKKKSTKKYELGSKSLFLTYPKCSCLPDLALQYFKLKYGSQLTYVVFCREIHVSGEYHLHGLLQGDPKFRINSPFTLDIVIEGTEMSENYHGHYEGARDALATRAYVMKHGDYVEWGNFLSNSKKDVAIERRRKHNELLLSQPLTISVQTGQVGLLKYCEAKKSILAYNNDIRSLPAFNQSENIWIYGASETGKSRWARANTIRPYFKAQNKWWDGYNGEEHVILDDLDSSCISHYLKIWADNYPGWVGEIKGDYVYPFIKKFIVTSNFSIENLFGPQTKEFNGDDTTWRAIKRRFREATMILNSVTNEYEIQFL